MKIVMHNCFHFECNNCLAINICDIDNFEHIYYCEACNKSNIITFDDFTSDGILVSTDEIIIKESE